MVCSLGERYSIAENIVGLESQKEFEDFYHKELQEPSTTNKVQVTKTRTKYTKYYKHQSTSTKYTKYYNHQSTSTKYYKLQSTSTKYYKYQSTSTKYYKQSTGYKDKYQVYQVLQIKYKLQSTSTKDKFQLLKVTKYKHQGQVPSKITTIVSIYFVLLLLLVPFSFPTSSTFSSYYPLSFLPAFSY